MVVVGGGGCSQRLLSLNPTTVMVVLLMGLWLLLGCDNSRCQSICMSIGPVKLLNCFKTFRNKFSGLLMLLEFCLNFMDILCNLFYKNLPL